MCVRFRAAAEAGIVAARRKLRISFPIRPLISPYRATYFSLLAQRKCRQKKRHPGFRVGAAHRYPAMLERQAVPETRGCAAQTVRSEEHTSELQSLMSISYGVFHVQTKIKYTHK